MEGVPGVQPVWPPPRPALSVDLFLAFPLIHALFGWCFRGQHSFAPGNDDAILTFRHAANPVGHGVSSFNPGDDPPVEG